MHKNELITNIELLKTRVEKLEKEKEENLIKIKNAKILHEDCSTGNISIIKN